MKNDLDMDTSKFMNNIAEAQNFLSSSQAKMNKTFDEARIASAGLNGSFLNIKNTLSGGLGFDIAASMIADFTSVISNSLTELDKLAKTSERLGIGATELAGLRHAAEQSGSSIDGLDKSLEKMVMRVNEASDGLGTGVRALDALNLNANDLKNLKPDEMFLSIAEAMGQIENQNKKVQLAYELMGSRGVEMINIMDLGVDGIRALMEESKNLGRVYEEGFLKAVEDANDKLDESGKKIQSAIDRIVIKMAPFIEDIVTVLTSDMTQDEIVSEFYEYQKLGLIAKDVELRWSSMEEAILAARKVLENWDSNQIKWDPNQKKLKFDATSLKSGKNVAPPVPPVDDEIKAKQGTLYAEQGRRQSKKDVEKESDKYFKKYLKIKEESFPESKKPSISEALKNSRQALTEAQELEFKEFEERYKFWSENLDLTPVKIPIDKKDISDFDHAVGNIKAGLQEFATDGENAFLGMKDASYTFFQGLNDSLVNFAITGKATFADVLNSYLRMVAQMTMQKYVTGPFAELLDGWIGGGTPGSESKNSKTHVLTQNPRFIDLHDPNIRTAANGGIVSGPKSGYPAILHGTEAVIPLNDKKALSPTVNVQVVNNANSNVSVKNDKNGDIQIMIDEAMAKNVNKRGNFSNAMESTYNQRPKLISR